MNLRETSVTFFALLTLCLTLTFVPTALAEPASEIATQPAATSETQGFERWYVLRLDGQRAGWMHSTEMHANERITTDVKMKMAIRRGQVALEIGQDLRWIETTDGEPIEAESTLNMGSRPMTKRVLFDDDAIRMITPQGEQKLPMPEGEWLPPAAAARLAKGKMDAGAKHIAYRTMDISFFPQIVDVETQVVGHENIEVMGKTVPAVVWEVKQSILPGAVMREYVDEDGRSLRSRVTMGPGMTLDIVEADKALALSELDAPELMMSTLVKPKGDVAALGNGRGVRRAVYTLQLTDDGVGRLDLPRTGYQRVVWADERTAKVIVDLDSPVAPGADVPGPEHLASTTMLDHENEAVKDLAIKVHHAKFKPSAVDWVEKLRPFVHKYIDEKDLAVGFATASDVARTKQGDCSEHAVLLAALLRAKGVPSRTVSGLLFVDGFLGQDRVFGYHMWTQAWIEDERGGRWVDLDPVLDGHDFDATHIALQVSALADDAMVNDLMQLTQIIGGIEIEVNEAE